VGVGRAAHQCNIFKRSEAGGDGWSAARFTCAAETSGFG